MPIARMQSARECTRRNMQIRFDVGPANRKNHRSKQKRSQKAKSCRFAAEREREKKIRPGPRAHRGQQQIYYFRNNSRKCIFCQGIACQIHRIAQDLINRASSNLRHLGVLVGAAWADWVWSGARGAGEVHTPPSISSPPSYFDTRPDA